MEYTVEMRNITKRFPGIVANDNVSLKVKKGEIHAILGENGAGKSTLMSILFGLYQADEGQILINGKEVSVRNPRDANRLGIGMVHQHFKLIHNFSVLENIILGVETVSCGFLKMEEAAKRVRRLSEKYHLNIVTDALITNITVGMQQRVEILKMLYKENDILIFDEPTAVLTPQEIGELMKILKQLASEGKTIIIITHKLNEIKEAAEKCTILRQGKYVATVDVETTGKEKMSEMMVGREIEFHIEKKPVKQGEIVLEVKELTVKSRMHDRNIVNKISFHVRKGEITCIAGIDGNGQSELIYALTGLMPAKGGDILLNGEDMTKSTIRFKNEHGIAHIPEDRLRYGLIHHFTLEENLILKKYFKKEFQRHGFFKFRDIRRYAENLIREYDIRAAKGGMSITGSMSGGNQQKTIIAREIDLHPEVLIAVQPTRGVDVGAAEYIHRQLIAQRDAGKAVLLVSFELEEVMDISDRILVMYEGEMVGDLKPEEITVQELGLYMSGSKGRQTI